MRSWNSVTRTTSCVTTTVPTGRWSTATASRASRHCATGTLSLSDRPVSCFRSARPRRLPFRGRLPVQRVLPRRLRKRPSPEGSAPRSGVRCVARKLIRRTGSVGAAERTSPRSNNPWSAVAAGSWSDCPPISAATVARRWPSSRGKGRRPVPTVSRISSTHRSPTRRRARIGRLSRSRPYVVRRCPAGSPRRAPSTVSRLDSESASSPLSSTRRFSAFL